MKKKRVFVQVLPFVALVLSLILPASAGGVSVPVHLPDDHSVIHSMGDSSSLTSAMILSTPQGNVTPMVATGGYHTVGLRSDGAVVAAGDDTYGQCNVSSWTDIVQVAAGGLHTVGLRSDGTVVAVGPEGGDLDFRQCDVSSWRDIVQIAAGSYYTVGPKSDGTAVATGNGYGQPKVSHWRDIVQVAAGSYHAVGLRSDGTVVAVGSNQRGECDVSDWTDVVQIAAGSSHTVGLKSDGTVIAVGYNDDGQCDVSGWTDIIQVSAGYVHTVGLRADGTTIAAGLDVFDVRVDIRGWADIVQVAAGYFRIVGLKRDGKVVMVSMHLELDVSAWNLGIASAHTLTITSTIGGEVTSPDEEAFDYDAGGMVRLVAEPDAGYRFANWSGDVSSVFNVNSATTAIAMTGNYSITANFEEKPPISWAFIGGILAGVTGAGLAIFFVRRRRIARTQGR